MWKLKTLRIATLIVLAITMQPTGLASQKANGARALRVHNGRLLVNGKLEYKNFSLLLDHFNYLFLYVPQRGLFIVSDKPFDDAAECGAFEESSLTFQSAGVKVRMESSSTILTEETTPVWVKFDSSFNRDAASVVLGFGDRPTDVDRWKSLWDSLTVR